MPLSDEAFRSMDEDLLKRTQESYDTRNDRGTFGSYFKEGAEFPRWTEKAGEHLFDTVPYLIGENHPLVRQGKAKAGQWGYVLIVFIHKGVGVNSDSYLCNAKTYGTRCPVCEYQKYLRDNGDRKGRDEKTYFTEVLKPLNPSRRSLYNVIVQDTEKESAEGVKVYEVAHWFMESKLVELAKGVRGTGAVAFSHPKTGKTVWFNKVDQGNSNWAYEGHKFIERTYEDGSTYEITRQQMEQAYCLEDLIYEPTYDEVYNAFWAGQQVPSNMGGPLTSEAVGAETSGRLRSGGESQSVPPPSGDLVCPINSGTFGVDIDKLDGCQTCNVYKECFKENEKNAAPKTDRAQRAQQQESPPAQPATSRRMRR